MSEENISDIRNYLKKLDKTITIENKNYNNALQKLENFSSKQIEKSNIIDFLYPSYLDPDFNNKITNKKEFNDLTYDTEIKNVVENSEILCNSKFELSPHQVFIHNFMSNLTPYNSILLFHGLGTGKTCSAINVCESTREYLNQMGIKQKILIIASPNVQENFKVQLFDERKLTEVNGLWDIRACTGNKFIKEINPMNMKGLKKSKIVKQIKNIIKNNYEFMGYTQFSNTVTKIKEEYSGMEELSKEELREKIIERIKHEYSNKLIVIDEVHNIRITGDSPNKDIGKNLLDVIIHGDNIKLLLLSATPMFNNYIEIIWLLNLMNTNDNRPLIEVKDIFNKEGEFKKNGKELLIEKARGYISYVRGENPYTFPYRIYPNEFNSKISIKNKDFEYPDEQINNLKIEDGIKYVDIYINKLGKYQREIYNYSINQIKDKITADKGDDKGIGWQQVDIPLQLLNFTYPIDNGLENIKRAIDEKESVKLNEYIGLNGLSLVMNKDTGKLRNFEYKEKVLKKYGRIFTKEKMGKYSQKMKNMMEMIENSEGIVLIYSQYIGGGCVPIALALEEMGIDRLNSSKNLFTKQREDREIMYVDNEKKNPAKYIMITGDKVLSPNNANEIKEAVSDENINGKNVKVIIISKAGSEGIDFKNIRQIHIMEPWYNMSRLEQIIGRGVRFCSHKQLPFKKRNVEIYLYGTDTETNIEAIDLYIYRMAERKAIQIGKITRILKEYAIDCRINMGLTNLTVENIDQTEKIELSSGKKIDYQIGDKPYTQICDYMDTCEYTCKPEILEDEQLDLNTYNKKFIALNVDKVMSKIKELYKREFIYSKNELLFELQISKKYPLIQINNALNNFIENKTEYIIDMFGRSGNLINIGEYYFFQPLEVSNIHMSHNERSKPINYKRPKIKLLLKNRLEKQIESINVGEILSQIMEKYIIGISKNSNEELIRSLHVSNLNWYIYANLIFRFMQENIEDIDEKTYKKQIKLIIIQKAYDMLDVNNKIALLEHILLKTENGEKLSFIENQIFTYIEEKQMINKNSDKSKKAYLFVSNNFAYEFFIFDGKKLEKQNYLENIELYSESFESKKVDIKNVSKDILGFIAIKTKNENILSFKMKSINSAMDKKNKGSNCSQASTRNITNFISLLDIIDINEIKRYININKRAFYCVLLEVLLRYKDINKINKERCFFNVLESKISRIVDLVK
jgi:hypothetical protein